MKLKSDNKQFRNNRFPGSLLTRNYRGDVRNLLAIHTKTEVEMMTAMQWIFETSSADSCELTIECSNASEYDFAWRELSALRIKHVHTLETRTEFSNNSGPCRPGDTIRASHTKDGYQYAINIVWTVPETAGKEQAQLAYS